ncbi:MAG: SDR family oxidoreductase [Betaproteobacteria bacterium]|nr:SDR family oxidoreductase [Betaproteobacteria bacterium]
MTDRLKGKVAIVTGAGSGIGRRTAELFAAEGAKVACADVVGEAANETAKAIGATAIGCRVDVSVPGDVEQMVADAFAKFGAVDVLYANAGVGGKGNAMVMSLEEWNRMIAINLTGVWLSCKYALPHMVKQGRGSLILQSSVRGLVGIPALPHYSAAKAGVIGLTRQIAVEYGPKGVRCNAIAPGTIMTPLVEGVWRAGGGIVGAGGSFEEMKARAAAPHPLGRIGTTDDCANLALFLASDESAWITGVTVPLDGGLTAG